MFKHERAGMNYLLLLIAGVIGGAGAGIFTTDPTNAQTITLIGGLHTLFGLAYIIGFPIVVTFARVI